MLDKFETEILKMRDEIRKNAKLVILVDIYFEIADLDDDHNQYKMDMKNAILELIVKKESELL